MISKIRNWLKSKKLFRNIDSLDMSSISIVPLNPVAQEDTRDAATRVRVEKAFDQQQQQMQFRAMIAHESGCDVFSCTKVSCFKWEPDIIVKKTIVKSIRNRTKNI